jgi:hypothetical protein
MVRQTQDEAETGDPWELLPAWFTERFMGDVWFFGLLLDTGGVLAIRRIDAVSLDVAGNLWLDVEMLGRDECLLGPKCEAGPLIYSPTSRCQASVNAARVVAAFELADT